MRITFRRFPGRVDAYSEIGRDDGAVFRMAEFTRGGARLSYDLRHLIVELELGVTDGIWGTIADSGIYTSMRFADGRRLPHDAARKSDALSSATRRARVATIVRSGRRRAACAGCRS